MDAAEWQEKSFQYDNRTTEFFRRFECSRITPEMLDALLADAWRHHGTTFFRDMFNIVGDQLRLVVPLRLRVRDFTASRSQKRILKRNADLRCEFGPVEHTALKEQMFKRHAERFVENRPEQLSDFITRQAHFQPCRTLECRVYDGDSLLAVSYISQGRRALSSIYAMFEPAAAQRSLGIYTLLCEIDYAQKQGYDVLYLGYAHSADTYYDYKKSFRPSEFFDWCRGWLPYDAHLMSDVHMHPLDGLSIAGIIDEAEA